MMTCEDCIHYDVCEEYGFEYCEETICHNFKDKDMGSHYKNIITGEVVELVAIDDFYYYPVLVREVSTGIERRYEMQYFTDNFRIMPNHQNCDCCKIKIKSDEEYWHLVCTRSSKSRIFTDEYHLCHTCYLNFKYMFGIDNTKNKEEE